MEFLNSNAIVWQARSHPRGSFCLDLMQSPAGHCGTHDFSWTQYLNSTEWGRRIVLDVREFYLVWLEQRNRPGFWLRLRNGNSGTTDVLAAGRCEIKLDAEADEVSWR
jgi:hypothetical protein